QHSMERLGEISGELLMIWGKQDPHIPASGRAQVYQALAAADKTFTWHEFNGPHAFMRDEGDRYDPQLAMIGNQLALDLFGRQLRH
ncbi:MAG: dienelactone hydrolase family protein, partial [Deefgea sp.]